MKTLATIALVFGIFSLRAQTESTVLILTNRKASVIFDGETKGISQPNVPFKVITTAGEHYGQVQYDENGKTFDKGDIIQIEAGKQKILKLEFEEQQVAVETPVVKVNDLNFSIPGLVSVTSWKNNNPDASYPYPSHYIAFEKGDVIVLNTNMSNKNGTNIIEVATHPNNVVKYSNNKFTELSDVEIKVEERSIYRFTFATNHAFDRNCFLRIGRKPASPELSNFNTNVTLKTVYTPVTIIEPSLFRVNSGSNAMFSGGKSRVVVPVHLPENTDQWFYRFSASRNPDDVENVRKNFKLFGDLTKLLLSGSGLGVVGNKAIDIGVNQLTQPPGADYCDIFLLAYDHIQNFEAKNDGQWQYILDGSRENFMSGNAKSTCCRGEQVYIGIRNPSAFDAINVSIEVVAITSKVEYVMENGQN